MTNRTKKLFSILLLVCMIISMIPVVASAATSKVYLKPNANWKVDNARFAAYFWNTAGDTWVDAVAVEGGYYEVTVPSGYSNIIFCRMSPSATANNWTNKWNQTDNLTVPTDGTNCFTVAEGTWDKGGGTWSTINVEPEVTEPSTPSTPKPPLTEYYLIGYIDGADYGDGEDYANFGDYKFENGTVTATFAKTSYVCVKNTDMVWYMTDGWQGNVTSATLYNTSLLGEDADKLMVPAGTYTFTLVENADGTMTLSYAAAGGPVDPSDPTTPSVPDETDPTDPTVPDGPGTVPVGDFYLFGYIDKENYNGFDYKFVNGKVTAKFELDSYVYVLRQNDGKEFMTNGWMGEVSSAVLYSTAITGNNSNKLFVPGGVQVTFTLVDNGNDTYTLSYTYEGAGSASDYYLFGYIDGVEYAVGGPSVYKFENGKLTTKFKLDSYVGVKNGDNTVKYFTKGWQGGLTSVTLYPDVPLANQDKMMVPGGVEVTFTLKVNADNTVTLSYVRNEDLGWTDETGIQDGVTLHAWNWSFNAIKNNMALIASQGYTAVQTSPIQVVKESTAGKDMHGVWWVQYQPVDFVINTASDNPIGTASEFAAMCAEAEKYGVKVIVDVVANHMANHMSNNTLSLKIPEYIRLDTSAWHDYTKDTTAQHYNDGDRYGITQYCMGGVPDLNTGSDKVQSYVLNFLKECIDAGADGFRFDGAKHIETPDDDATFASDFWPTVIGGAEDYAESLGREIYFYGELLDNPGKLPIVAYTKYMAATDNSWGNGLRGAVAGGNAAYINTGYNKAVESDLLVVWAESHDTYATDDANQSSYDLSASVINKTWALVAARADIMGLYFARPADFYATLMGDASLNTGWDFAEVKAVNLFHNAFAGQGEKVGNSGNIAYVVRGNSGIVLVNTSGTTASVSISGTGLANGTYKDQVSGTSFTVSGGKITGSIGSTGIAVVYNAGAVHEHSYTAVVTDPTCTEDGYTTYTCSCGDSYVADKVAALGHNYVSGKCTRCGAVDPNYSEPAVVPTLTGSSFSLSFESEILVNFYYTVSDTTDVVEQGMLVFYSNPTSADINKADDVYAGSASNNGVYLNTTKGIAAKYMGDTRYYAAYAKLTDGTFAYSKLYSYSPKKYATNMLSKSSTSAAQKALCVAMLNYGAAAQNYFGYRTDDLMNASLTAAQQALVIPYDASLFKGAIAADASKTTNFPKNTDAFSLRSATVSFEGAFAINYYFAPSNTIVGDMTLYYWTPADYAAASKLTTANATGTMNMVASGDGSYWGQVSGIAAKHLDETYYVAGVYKDASGNTYCTGIIAYSLSRYCLNNAKPGKDMQELAANTAMYGYYADAYFANK